MLNITGIAGEAINGFVRVFLSRDAFDSVRGVNPKLPFTIAKDSKGTNIRVFDFDGVKLYASYDSKTLQTTFIMKEEDAQKALDSVRENVDISAFRTPVAA